MSRAEHHSGTSFCSLKTLGEVTTGCSFPASVLYLLGFHRLENQVSALLAQIVPPSSPAISKATRGYLYKEIFAENPLLGPCGAPGLFFPSSMQQKSCFQPSLLQRQQPQPSSGEPAPACTGITPRLPCLHPGHVPALLLVPHGIPTALQPCRDAQGCTSLHSLWD